MKPNHFRIFLHALRTGLLIVAGFIIYDILMKLEKTWNTDYSNKIHNFAKRKIYKFIMIFLIDLMLLYIFFYVFKIAM